MALTPEQRRANIDRATQKVRNAQGGLLTNYKAFQGSTGGGSSISQAQQQQQAIQDERIAKENEAKYQEQALDQTQRGMAQKKLGVITRVSTDPRTGEKTYYGISNQKYTFPKGGVTYSGADKFGGIKSRENPFGSEQQFQSDTSFEQKKMIEALGEKVGRDLTYDNGIVTERLPITESKYYSDYKESRPSTGNFDVLFPGEYVQDNKVYSPRATKTYNELSQEEKNNISFDAFKPSGVRYYEMGLGRGREEEYGKFKNKFNGSKITEALSNLDPDKNKATEKQGTSFTEVDKLIIPEFIKNYTNSRANELNQLPDYSFKQTISSPNIFAYEVTKGLSRPIANFLKGFSDAPVETSVYTYGAFKILGALPKTKLVNIAIPTVFVGSKVIQEPTKFLKPAGYLETGSEFAYWSLAFKGIEKGKGSKAEVTTNSYKNPIDEIFKTAPTKKKGNIETLKTSVGDITSIKGDGLNFEYPRMQILKKAIGKNAPQVSVSKGIITRGEDKFNLNAVTVGRKTYGTILGKNQDILFIKGNKGGILTKVISKSGKVLSKRNYPYIPEELKFKVTNRLGQIESSKKNLDIGVKQGDETFYNFRNVERIRKIKTIAGQKEFRGGRDITKSFSGKAESKLFQSDIAGLKTKTTKVGNNLIIEKYPTDIKYALQPSYKPNIKRYSTTTTREGVIPISESIIEPMLGTTRETKFKSTSKYSLEKSRVKPLKSVASTINSMGKKGQIGLTVGKSSIETMMPTPELYKPNTKIPVSAEELFRMIPSNQRAVFPITRNYTSQKPESNILNKSISKSNLFIKSSTEVYSKTPTRIEDIIKSKTYTNNKIFSLTKTPTKTQTRTQTKTESILKTLSKTQTKTPTKTKVSNRLNTFIPTIPSLPPPSFQLFNTGKAKKKKKEKKFKRKGQYASSITASGENIFGKETGAAGIGIRPIRINAKAITF